MNVLRIGVIGAGRGKRMMSYCEKAKGVKLVAVCDKYEPGLEQIKNTFGSEGIALFTDYSKFLKCDMDVVMLANYATEHAPFAIAAMEAGKDVISEVLPCQTMAEAVQLIECVQRTGKKYCYAENYCYIAAPLEMKRKFDQGLLGEFEYGEGEYMHNCEPIWPDITYGDPDHWRNNMSTFFYCTHSVGPLIHIARQRPVRVSGFEIPFNAKMASIGAKSGAFGVEMVTLESGAVLKSLHGTGPSRNSVWYSIYGTKGRVESGREDVENGSSHRYYQNLDCDMEGDKEVVKTYIPECDPNVAADFPDEDMFSNAHSKLDDYTCLYYALDYIRGNEEADVIDVFEALDMWMCGHWAYLSCLDGGMPKEIPDLRDPAVREQFRNDNRCTDPKVAGDQLLPSYSKGNPEIPASVYQKCRQQWEENERAAK